MSADKYPSIFSRQMEAIVYIYKRFPPKLESLDKREQYIFCQFEDVSQNLKQALEIHLLAAAAL